MNPEGGLPQEEKNWGLQAERKMLLWFCPVLACFILVFVEVVLLLGYQQADLVGKIFGCVNGFIARDLECRAAGQGLQNLLPAQHGFTERLK